MKRYKQIIISIVFCLMITFPFINSSIHIFKDLDNSENRQLADEPEIDLAHLDDFPKLYSTYYKDNFNGRNYLSYFYNWINYNYVITESPVIIGKDKWLFTKKTALIQALGKNKLSDEELVIFKKEIQRREHILDSLGGKYYFVIAPNKASIYHKQLPSNLIQILPDETRTDQIVRILNQEPKNNFIDLRPLIKEKAKTEQMFLINDNHWNKLAGYYVTEAITNKILADSINIRPPFPKEKYNFYMKDVYGGNLISNLGLANEVMETIPETNPSEDIPELEKLPNADYPVTQGFAYPWEFQHRFKSNCNNKIKALIVRDSFTINIMPFINQCFENSVYIWDAWQYKLNEDILFKEKPDVYITIALENHLQEIIRYSPYNKK